MTEETKEEEQVQNEETGGNLSEPPKQQETPVVETPPSSSPSTPSAVSSVLKSGISRIASSVLGTLGGFLKKGISLGLMAITGGTSKLLTTALKVGGKILSFLGGLFGGAGQTDTGDNLKKISLAILALVILPIFLILALSIFDMGVLKPTAMVDRAVEPTIITPSGGPEPSTPDSNIPHGFPGSSTCVTGLPGVGTHKTNGLNAIDIGAILYYNAWVVRSTHAGRVLLAGTFDNYGQTVVLESLDKRYITYYGHMDYGSLKVTKGDVVPYWAALGTADDTGFSFGNHIHYELRGPATDSFPYGTKTGDFGQMGTIMNFIPSRSTWSNIGGGCFEPT